MNLKNYTSTVPSDRSISKIERLLVSIGAKNINKTYDNGKLVAITFLVNTSTSTLVFKLPAKVDVVKKILYSDVKRPRPGTEEKVYEQAERTAWKIISDWVEIQVSMIQLQQAEVVEVFLPYAYSPELDQTFYQRIESSGMKLLNA